MGHQAGPGCSEMSEQTMDPTFASMQTPQARRPLHDSPHAGVAKQHFYQLTPECHLLDPNSYRSFLLSCGGQQILDKLIFIKSWPRGGGSGGHHMCWKAMVSNLANVRRTEASTRLSREKRGGGRGDHLIGVENGHLCQRSGPT